MAADISKSLVHIQERFIARGQFTQSVTVPATASIGTPVAVSVPTTVGIKAGDTVVAVQPADATEAAKAATAYVTAAYVTADNAISVQFAGTNASSTAKNFVFTIFGRGF